MGIGGPRLTGQVLLRYREEVAAPFWLQAVLFGALVAVGVALVAPLFGNGQSTASYVVYYVSMVIALALALFAFTSFRSLSVVVSDERLQVGFGPLKKSIPLQAVRSCEVEKYRWLTYGGWGIRFATKGRRAYSMPGVSEGVQVSVEEGTKERRYFVSSHYPERLAAALKS